MCDLEQERKIENFPNDGDLFCVEVNLTLNRILKKISLGLFFLYTLSKVGAYISYALSLSYIKFNW